MIIRRAETKDIPKVMNLLSQVLELHAEIRPDIFISGATKYTEKELSEIFEDDMKPVYVAADNNDEVTGYAFCIIKEPVKSNNLVPRKYIFIDDLCVDKAARGQGAGRRLFEFVKEEAEKLSCCGVMLNVWEGNDNALRFYEKMGMRTRAIFLEFKF